MICECGGHSWFVASGGYVGLVSPEDAHIVEGRSFHASIVRKPGCVKPYIYSSGGALHRELISPTGNAVVDHKDGNPLNNKRDNLRECTRGENSTSARKRTTASTSKYKGVSYAKDRDRWRATIKADKKLIGIGYFKSDAEAAKAYDTAAKKLHGEFAMTNEMMGLL